MKYVSVCIFLLISLSGYSRTRDTFKVHNQVLLLDKALINQDTAVLHKLLSTNVTYGHSNGWVELYGDVCNDLTLGKLTYNSITTNGIQCIQTGKTIGVRCTSQVVVTMSGQQIKLTLKVAQVWVKQHGSWVLFSRQSVKV